MIRAVGSPLDPREVLDRAIQALHNGQSAFPIDDVNRALSHAPNDFRLWHVKGLIERELDRRELAIPALRRASGLAPNEPLVAHGYARTLLEAGLPCVDEFAHALKLDRSNGDVVKGYIAALKRAGRGDEAIDALQSLVRRLPTWVDGHCLLAELRWARGDRDEFTRSFDEALSAYPDNVQLRREQLMALIQGSQLGRVAELVAQGNARCGKQPIFTLSEAILQSETGKATLADALFAELAPLKVASFDLWHVRHLLRSGRPAEAAAESDKWLKKPEKMQFLPYAHTAWRLTGDTRLEWLVKDQAQLGVYELAGTIAPLARLADLLRDLHKFEGQPLVQSVRGGSQTDGNLFQRIEPEIVNLREAVRTAVAEHAMHMRQLPADHPSARESVTRVRFSGSWSVRLTAGGHHANHVHPMGWLSSAIYIALPSGLGGHDHDGWLTLGEPDANLNAGLPPIALIEPKPGRLVLFPSWLWHGTRPFGEGERITVAFDIA